MTEEKEALKGEDFIQEALPFFLGLEEERKAREGRERLVIDYRGVNNVSRPPELERGVAEAIGNLSAYGSNLDLSAAWHQLPAGSVGSWEPSIEGRSRSTSPCV